MVLAGAAAAFAGLVSGGKMQPLDGLLYDLSLALTDRRPGNREEPVAVIALDRNSLDSDQLKARPRVFLSPEWAKVVNALREADARAIGFDMIFAYSANDFPGFKEQGQYDWEFLAALKRARDRVVLARSGHTVPHRSFFYSVFDPAVDPANADPGGIATVTVTPDADGVFRDVKPRVDGLTTLASALLTRAHGPAMPAQLLLAPSAPLEAIPAYRLIDVLRCIDSGPAAIRDAFAGKVVLVGTNLPEEDRMRTPDRFMAPPSGREDEIGGCRLDRLGASDPGSGTSPGVFVHAAGVEEVLTGDLVRPLPWLARAAAAAAFAIAGAWLGFALRPWIAATGVVILGSAGFVAALILLGLGWWFALVVPFGSAILAMVFAYIVRFLVEERRRRRVQEAFRYYLAPAMVDRLADSEAELELGGELREISVMFADLKGFTAMSGRLGPAELMDLTNAYLALVVEAVEATGGYVVDYVGDAVMAMWGAPLDDPEHAAHAATAAIQAFAKVTGAKAAADARGTPGYAVRMGINSGPAVVGKCRRPRPLQL
jgi:CHASE2 domain-containing sensor protein